MWLQLSNQLPNFPLFKMFSQQLSWFPESDGATVLWGRGWNYWFLYVYLHTNCCLIVSFKSTTSLSRAHIYLWNQLDLSTPKHLQWVGICWRTIFNVFNVLNIFCAIVILCTEIVDRYNKGTTPIPCDVFLWLMSERYVWCHTVFFIVFFLYIFFLLFHNVGLYLLCHTVT